MRRAERWLVVALCAAIGWFYVWTVRSSGEEWGFGNEQRDYYNLLIDGYLDGQLHMKVEVPDELLRLRNPYDPQERPPGLLVADVERERVQRAVLLDAPRDVADREPPERRPIDHEQHPAGRIGTPRDIASAIEWLGSDSAGFITGQSIVIDGGMSVKMIYAE